MRLQPKSGGTDVSVVNETLAHPRETSLKRLSRDKIQTVTSGTFTRLVLEAEGPIAVEFMSYGCAHCRAIEPVLEQVAEMVKAEEKIFRVNIAVEQELAGSYQIQGTPTLVMFLNQNEVGRVEGPSPTVSSVLAAVTQPFQS
ncbi:MAG: thioredoxin family protein [Candidatus Acidiferrum sp.]